ncbi:hypothetical protein AQ737_23365 [Burkholderia pseudomallei]|nr:hypothetical protein AQ737_23365 [Burkholderia pseudomallei]ONC05611.1 hypothetical protein AQ909_29320 [Burkholderia pseudomallei]
MRTAAARRRRDARCAMRDARAPAGAGHRTRCAGRCARHPRGFLSCESGRMPRPDSGIESA